MPPPGRTRAEGKKANDQAEAVCRATGCGRARATGSPPAFVEADDIGQPSRARIPCKPQTPSSRKAGARGRRDRAEGEGEVKDWKWTQDPKVFLWIIGGLVLLIWVILQRP